MTDKLRDAGPATATPERPLTTSPGVNGNGALAQRAAPRFGLWRRQGRWRDAVRRRMLAAADLTAVLIAVGAISVVSVEDPATTLVCLALVPLWMLVGKGYGLYDTDHARIHHLTISELPTLFHWATISAAGTVLGVALAPVEPMSASSAVMVWAVAFAAAFGLRGGVRALWRRTVLPEQGLLIGDGQLADALERKLKLEPGHHLALRRFPVLVDGDGPQVDLRQLRHAIAEHDVERVVLALHDLDEQTLSGVVALCRDSAVKLSVAPPLRAMLGTAVSLTHMAELPLIEFKTWDPSRSTMLIKRTVDVLVSATALVVLAPLLGLVALVVRLDSRGPAFFVQPRAGKGGRSFRMVKFRTMVRDASEKVGDVVRLEDLRDPMFKLRSDPRVTRVGRVLRRWSLDELPQLWNVLRGDMSLVGPRPEETWLVERYAPAERFRLDMRPGMTGPMQIHGRGELSFQERLAVEREYIENYSLSKDLHILLRTFSVVAHGPRAF